MEQDVARRLLVAVLLSAALHLSLIFGVAIRPPRVSPPNDPIFARLETASAQPAQQALADGAKPSERHSLPLAKARSPDAARVHSVAAPQASRQTDVQIPSSTENAAPYATPPALPAVEMPLLADPTWYPAKELDVFPAALDSVRPTYPASASADNVSGEVTLLLLIDEAGRVNEASVVDAQPQGYFEEAALAAFGSARFAPGQRDGRQVRSRILVKVLFGPSEAAPGHNSSR